MENSEKDKRNKSPWVPKRERRGRKKKEKEKFSEVRKETLAESDKGSWYQQPSEEESTTAAIPSTSSSRKKLRKDTLETMPVELDEDLDPEDVNSPRSSSDECDESHFIDNNRCVIFHKRNLQEGLDETVSCRKCGSDVELKQLSRAGIAGEWVLQCHNQKCPLSANPRSFHATVKSGRCYDVNRAFVLAFRLIGRGHG